MICALRIDSSCFEYSDFARPKPGYSFVGVFADIYNGSSELVSVNPFSFSLLASSVEYDPSFSARMSISDWCTDLPAVTLHPGGRIFGYIGFEIPVWSTPSTIYWVPLGGRGDYQIEMR